MINHIFLRNASALSSRMHRILCLAILFLGITFSHGQQTPLQWSYDQTNFVVAQFDSIILTATITNTTDHDHIIQYGGGGAGGDLQKTYTQKLSFVLYQKVVPARGVYKFEFARLTPVGGYADTGTYHEDPTCLNFTGTCQPPTNSFRITVLPGTAISEHGGYGSINIESTGAWTAVNPAAWITIVSGQNGFGNGVVQFYAVPNDSDVARSTHITIGTLHYKVSQPARRWRMVGASDFDTNGTKDVLWQNSDGRLAVWLLEGNTRKETVLLNQGRQTAPGWVAVGLNDFNNNGKTDILWQHLDGRLAMWYMNGLQRKTNGLFPSGLTVPFGWLAKAVADLDGDAKDDIVFSHLDGRVAVWGMDGFNRRYHTTTNNKKPARRGRILVGAARFDSDRKADILWRHADGRLGVWFMDGASRRGSSLVNYGAPVGMDWTAGALADFDNNYYTDIAWRHKDGRTAIWSMHFTFKTSASLVVESE